MTPYRFVLFIALFAWLPPLKGDAVANAQADTAVRRTTTVAADSVHSPITPKKAFFSSLLLPGSAQNMLGRNRAGAAMIAVEAMSIVMIRESGADVREARQQRGDTLVMSYVDDRGDLLPAPVLQRRRFESIEVDSRRSHVEDWVALLIANHLFAACDAFVSANLWDVAAHVTIGGTRGQFLIIGQIPW